MLSDQLHFFETIHASLMIRTSSSRFSLIVLANCQLPGKLKWFINVVAVLYTQDWLATMDTEYRKGVSYVGCSIFSDRTYTSYMLKSIKRDSRFVRLSEILFIKIFQRTIAKVTEKDSTLNILNSYISFNIKGKIRKNVNRYSHAAGKGHRWQGQKME